MDNELSPVFTSRVDGPS